MEYNAVKMKKEHIDGIYRIEELSFPDPWSKKSFTEELKNERAHYLVIANEEGIVMAFGGFWDIVGEAHINNIAVHPDFRGKGLGNIIVEALIDEAKEYKLTDMTLEVRASNETAQNLYKKYGFKIAGIRREYYLDNREDAVIMWKNIEVINHMPKGMGL